MEKGRPKGCENIMVIKSKEKLKLGTPSKYKGKIYAASFDRISKQHLKYYRSQTQNRTIEAIREYLVEGKSSKDTSYKGSRQAFRSRLIYYIGAWEKSNSLILKDFKQ